MEVPTAAKPDSKVCVDEVGVLGSALCAKVAAILDADEQLTTDEIAVLVVGTTGDETIEHYATRTFNSWGIGKADKNNGVLLLVAIDDRALRIEVGTGLEKTLTDGEAEEIIYGTITPEFKAGDYRGGHPGRARRHPHAPRSTAVTSTNALAGLAGDRGLGHTPAHDHVALPVRLRLRRRGRDQFVRRQRRCSGSSSWSSSWWAAGPGRRTAGRNGYDDGDDVVAVATAARPTARAASRSFGSSSSHRSSGSSQPVVGPVRLRRWTLPRRRRQRFLVR